MNQDVDKTDVEYNIRKFSHGKEHEITKNCLQPCKTMQITKVRNFFLTNRLNNAKIKIAMNDKVTVVKAVYSYDLFNLIVDLGSALGLWLGLSALSIFDYTVLYLVNTKNTCSKLVTSTQTKDHINTD
jgi:hypothetical protein